MHSSPLSHFISTDSLYFRALAQKFSNSVEYNLEGVPLGCSHSLGPFLGLYKNIRGGRNLHYHFRCATRLCRRESLHADGNRCVQTGITACRQESLRADGIRCVQMGFTVCRQESLCVDGIRCMLLESFHEAPDRELTWLIMWRMLKVVRVKKWNIFYCYPSEMSSCGMA